MPAQQQFRRWAKAAAAGMLHYTGLSKAMAAVQRSQAGGRRVMIVSYHRVVDDFTGELARSIPGLLISKETFQRHLESAHASGFEFATLGHALDVMAGTRRADKDLFVVTFDDGYRDVYRHAFPVLKHMGVPATVYLPAALIGTEARMNHDRLFHLIGILVRERIRPLYDVLPAMAPVLLAPVLSGRVPLNAALDDFIGEYSTQALRELADALERQLGGGAWLRPENGDLMDWSEVRRMSETGVDFGAHTMAHSVLTLEPPEVIKRDLSESKAIIEKEIRRPVLDFAYCNGWYSDELIHALVELGYRSGVTTEDYANCIGGDPFTLKRKVLWENFSVGMAGTYSSALTACHLENVFGALRLNNPVRGRRAQLIAQGAP